MKLRISDDLALSADYVTATAGIFATKGMGKSFLAQVMAEEMLEHDQVIVVIDPTDVWHGLRSSVNGKGDGYKILIIGGDYGDLKLDPEPGAGTRLGEAIVAERFSCVICTDGLDDTRAIRYVREVLEAIYRKNRKPLHVFVDEADIFAPQVSKEEEDYRCTRVLSHVVRRGRKKGIGSTLITQRPAELNASVRAMVEMLFVLGLLHHLDIDAVEKWLRLKKKKRGSNAAFELQEDMIDSLDTLQRGDAWVWAPRLKIHKRFRARAKRTFDSGATPKAGKKAHKAKKLAPVDIVRLGAAIAEAAKRQKENDPTELRKQVASLRKELASVGKGQDRAEANDKENHAENVKLRVRVHDLEKQLVVLAKTVTVRPADLRRLEALVKKIEKLVLRITGTNADLELHLTGLRAEAGKLQAIATRVTQLRGKKAGALVGEVLALADDLPARPVATLPKSLAPIKPTAIKAPAHKRLPAAKPVAANGPRIEDLQPAHLRFLTAIAWWESLGVPSPDLGGVAFAAKTSTTSSAFNNNRSRLHAAGYIDYPNPGYVRLTDSGREIAPPPSLPPTNEAFQGAVLERVQPALRRLLSVLIDAYPKEVTLEDFAEGAGTSITSSAFNNNRSWLRARGLAEYPRTGFVRATPLLFPEAS